MGQVRVAIVGVGNCAASLVQGVHYYADADDGDADGSHGFSLRVCGCTVQVCRWVMNRFQESGDILWLCLLGHYPRQLHAGRRELRGGASRDVSRFTAVAFRLRPCRAAY